MPMKNENAMAGWSNNQQNAVVILSENQNRLYKAGITLILHTIHKWNTNTTVTDSSQLLLLSFPRLHKRKLTPQFLTHDYQNNSPYSILAKPSPENYERLSNVTIEHYSNEVTHSRSHSTLNDRL